jgi:hypothetical protein
VGTFVVNRARGADAAKTAANDPELRQEQRAAAQQGACLIVPPAATTTPLYVPSTATVSSSDGPSGKETTIDQEPTSPVFNPDGVIRATKNSKYWSSGSLSPITPATPIVYRMHQVDILDKSGNTLPNDVPMIGKTRHHKLVFHLGKAGAYALSKHGFEVRMP